MEKNPKMEILNEASVPLMNRAVGHKTRLTELDIVRGLAVLFMVVEHVNMYMTDNKLLGNPLFKLTQDGIGDVAVIFMFIMGMNTVFSKDKSPYNLFKRGCKIFLFSYVFNFIRDFLPALISCEIGTSKLIDYNYHHYYEIIMKVDIFQFVGLAFIFCGLLRMLRALPIVELIAGLSISISTLIIGKVTTSITFSNWVQDMLIGGWTHNYFPFICWIAYPVSGAFLARYLVGPNDRNLIYRKLTQLMLSIYLIGWCLNLYFYPSIDFYGWHDQFNYYRQNFIGNIFFLSQSILVIGMLYFALQNELIPEGIKRFLTFWSENITVLYIVSWLLITWSTWIALGFNFIERPVAAIGTTMAVIAITHLIVKNVPIIPRVVKRLF